MSRDVLDRLIQLFPAFAAYWDSEGDIYRDKDGSFAVCGVFLVFTGFVREHYQGFNPSVVDLLATYLDHLMRESDGTIAEAVATCFLENVTDEPFSQNLRSHLRGRPLEYFSQFV